ncbi:MAG TPA: YggU family protein [Desulfobulbus sp.]|nr:YggU family protein [Desulfobulbus sp.]
MPFVQAKEDGTLILSLYVQPRAGKNELAGLHDGALKLRLTTPPVDGKANKAVVTFLAKKLKLPKSAIVLRSGLKNRRKQVQIIGLDEQAVRERLGLP